MAYDLETLREEVKSYSQKIADRLVPLDGKTASNPGGSHHGWQCQNGSCISGHNQGGTGITLKGDLFKCWSCEWQGDIINLIQLMEPGLDHVAAVKKAAEAVGINTERHRETPERVKKPAEKIQTKATEPTAEETAKAEQTIAEAAKHIEETDYHRGISLETLKKYRVGFIKDYQHTPTAKPAPVLIIPTGPASYTARRTDTNEQGEKVRKKGEARPFNLQALTETDKAAIVITEGEIDALSVIDIGGEAIGIGGTAGTAKLTTAIKEILDRGEQLAAPLVLALDNDKPGADAQAKLEEKLEGLGLIRNKDFYSEGIKLYGEEKDANAALNRSRGQLELSIKTLAEMIKTDATVRADQYRDQESVKNLAGNFIDHVVMRYPTPIKTGWQSLDEILGGGIYPGLYFLGALSSIGKTTYALQLADQIAEQGHDILFISLEQSKEELIAKSISRTTFLIEREKKKPNLHNAKSVRGILDGSKYITYNQEERHLITLALDRYKKRVAGHMFIIEGRGEIGPEEIRAAIAKHEAMTGKPPVVFIDYLQILKAAEARNSDKQNTDKAVGDLYRIARDFKTPVITISSFNRDSYNRPASMSSFKESGGIEYSADIAIAIQPTGLAYGENKKDLAENTEKVSKCKSSAEKTMEVVILKNRSGRPETRYRVQYHAVFNHFEDLGTEEETKPEPERIKF